MSDHAQSTQGAASLRDPGQSVTSSSSVAPSSSKVLPRWLYLSIGAVSFALGWLGILLPVLPGLPFMVVAAWAFGKSSPRFEAWLLRHPWIGPGVRRFREHRVVPLSVKVFTILGMAATIVGGAIFAHTPWWGLVLQLVFLAVVTWWLRRFPSKLPAQER